MSRCSRISAPCRSVSRAGVASAPPPAGPSITRDSIGAPLLASGLTLAASVADGCSPVVSSVGEAVAQALQRLRPDLRDSRLGHVQDFGDLAQIELFVVVERQHYPLLLRQHRDGLPEPLHLLRMRERLSGQR